MTQPASGDLLGGRFRLLRELGRGAAGEVWLADDSELGEQVALKILSARVAADPRQVQLLRGECRKARALMHPNIVRVFDFHVDGNVYFISMQYIAGTSLSRLRGAPFQDIVGAAVMVCDALDYAHRQGMVHRDVKPANVLLDERGVCYLADFGIAAALPAAGDEPALRGGGSLPAMSPQQLDGEPPAVADDIYALGALLYDLLAGQPLFHPGITAERIRAELPLLPVVDGSGQSLPVALTRLVAAMLDKSPARRPAGMGAVRSVLEELRVDHPAAAPEDILTITPVARGAAANAAAPASARALPQAPPPVRAERALPARAVMAGLALLMVLAGVVVFVLPAVVQERGPVAQRPAPEPPRPADTGPDPAASAAQRQLADAVLGEMLPLEDRLRSQGVERWGGSDWAESRRLIGEGDDAYRARDYAAAATGYRRAQTLLKILEPQAAQVLAAALAAGDSALLAGDSAASLLQYQLAQSIAPDDERAVAGIARAERLDEVLALVARATELETAGDLTAAAEAYQGAVAIDPQWPAARDGLARTRAQVARGNYEMRMADGYAALSRQDFPAARSAFNAALKIRSGDADARSALAQLDAEERLQRVVGLEQAALTLEKAEDWQAAATKYEAALAIDAGLVSSRQGLERVRSRQQLFDELDKSLASSERFYEERIRQTAEAVLERGRAVADPGPQLSARTAELGRLLQLAAIPVTVRFQSDSLTQVVIYKIGRLGSFSETSLELRPGLYVAVGSRDGYRDVRRDFRVTADGAMPPVVVRCEERI